eukprot:14877473-Alexandrium_andersonii.AAC.1
MAIFQVSVFVGLVSLWRIAGSKLELNDARSVRANVLLHVPCQASARMWQHYGAVFQCARAACAQV